MAFSLSSPPTMRYLNHPYVSRGISGQSAVIARCELKDSAEEGHCGPSSDRNSNSGLKIGSPVIVTEAPRMIKTAASIPCLRVNSGLVKPGDVGRIVSRKPMDVWAVRLTIGTYLIDGKYFKPLELDE
ncbi:Dynein heavy chain 5, axonemal like [Actinidia chinensis var. chinensis]|uniref:Dynein heavy chain 5, axonemal like n=1 Tax=Actinidia chinensis var. chinensis TaxID=1590841 RepID=A0A2R6PRP8_ACTCC|nr:Dynein heavy chain 5, axonemal like [Actinidia chinensis var. chinensis]